MTERDISGAFAVLKETLGKGFVEDVKAEEREQAEAVVDAVFAIVEQVVVDLHRIATAAEAVALS